ncbi:MAG: hypothetical protein M3017_08670 [Actinomycetota bacterium]|nr:hypothetical protein [Actinomycetota bacterium]
MSGAAFGLTVLLLSIGATYFFCIRPMQKGNCAMGKAARQAGDASRDRDAGEEATRLKTEIAALRRQSSRPASK